MLRILRQRSPLRNNEADKHGERSRSRLVFGFRSFYGQLLFNISFRSPVSSLGFTWWKLMLIHSMLVWNSTDFEDANLKLVDDDDEVLLVPR